MSIQNYCQFSLLSPVNFIYSFMSKTFDTIDHNILQNKLAYYGLIAQPCIWSKVTYKTENNILKLNK